MLKEDDSTKKGNTRALIFHIQRFCVYDGPGIRTTIFFKGCPLSCAWCQNPESISGKIETAFHKDRCIGCLKCFEACPNNAIIKTGHERIDRGRCMGCGECVSVCMSGALERVGAFWTAEELLKEVLKDSVFFSDSGGGITLSGGEPALQAQFLKRFLPMVKDVGIHTNMETSGFF